MCVLVTLWWQLCSFLGGEGEDPWDPGSIGNWSRPMLAGWAMRERMLKSVLYSSLRICNLALLTHCFECCLGDTLSKRSAEKVPNGPRAQQCPANHTCKATVLSIPQCGQLLLAAAFLDRAAHQGVQITFWAVQLIFGSQVIIQNMIKMELWWHHRLARGTYTKYDKVEKTQGPTSLAMIMESTGKLKASFFEWWF